VQLRDLRLLDPQLALSYPSAILCREKALVVNLEHIKCIITTTYVLVLNADEENVISFIEDIQRRLMPADVDARDTRANGLPKSSSCGDLKGAEMPDFSKPGLPKIEETPFELRALEVALDVVTHMFPPLPSSP
jgi:magnesium transporter